MPYKSTIYINNISIYISNISQCSTIERFNCFVIDVDLCILTAHSICYE